MIFNYLGQYLTTPNVVYKPVKSRTSWLLSYNRIIGYENFIINDYSISITSHFRQGYFVAIYVVSYDETFHRVFGNYRRYMGYSDIYNEINLIKRKTA